MLQTGDAAPEITVHDHTGRALPLSELYRQPVVLFFERHLGCPFCREHVADVRDDYPRFQELGAEVVVVTMGSPEQAAEFREERKLPFDCLADPDQELYRAFDIPRGGMSQIAGPAVWGAGLKATLRGGVRQPQGDLQQLHGAVVIDNGGVVRYVHRAKSSADMPANDELLDVLRSLKSASSADEETKADS